MAVTAAAAAAAFAATGPCMPKRRKRINNTKGTFVLSLMLKEHAVTLNQASNQLMRFL